MKLLLIITLLCASYTVSAQTAGGLGNPPDTTGTTTTGKLIFSTPTPSFAQITIRSDGKIICHACKDVPPDAVIGTLTDAARSDLFPAITVPSTPKSPFSGITIGSDNLIRYNHARQTIKRDEFRPLKQSDFFRSFGPATIISTSICGAGQASDVISSTGYEGNSFLRGSDGRMNRSKAIPLKLGLCALPLAFESHVSRKVRIFLRITQIGIGALGFYDAVRNLRVNR